jgi:hypothetical protein
MDYRNGTPLVNGSAFTMSAILGVRVRVTDEIDAGAEFAAYTSQGNQIIGAYQGVTAPYLTNGFQGNPLGNNGAATGANAPFTRMVLNDFWIVHNPSQTKLVLGAFNELNIDPMIYTGMANPNASGPKFLSSYGGNLSGRTDISDAGVLRWELFVSELPDFSPYGSEILGVDAEFEFEGGSIKGNFARVTQGNGSGDGLVGAYGITGTAGISPGALAYSANGINLAQGASTGWTPLQWVNPGGYYAGQSGVRATGGSGDNRPIVGTAGGTDLGTTGGFGPQQQNMFGGSVNYKFDLGSGGNQIYVAGNAGHTDYRPSEDSGYTVGGNAFRGEVGANLMDGDLDIAVQGVLTDATYDPYILQYSPLVGLQGSMRLPDLNYFSGLYSLHDTSVYTQNRQGFKENIQWRFNDRRGLIWLKGAEEEQVKTSLYDVRQPGGSLAVATPTNAVLGFSPGFIDSVFSGFASPLVYGKGTGSAFNAALQPLENPRGVYNMWGLGASYKFDDPRLKIEAGYENHSWIRNSALTGAAGSQDQVSLMTSQLHGQVSWEATDKWTLRAGCDWTRIRGHYDPSGNYDNFAVASGSTTFLNIDDDQITPFAGLDYDMSANTKWTADARYYFTDSHTSVPTGITTAGLSPVGGSANPFNWHGWQLNTQFKVKF